MSKNVCKPLGNKYISNPRGLGEKIRNRRLELSLLQKEAAKIIGVSEACITLWENNKSKPYVKYYPKIIKFLGYIPFDIDNSTLGGQIKLYRYLTGLSQEELAIRLNVNESTVFHYEKNSNTPSSKTLTKIEKFVAQVSNRSTPTKLQ
jgi:DNA-binding XRE family transcriptional regulator